MAQLKYDLDPNSRMNESIVRATHEGKLGPDGSLQIEKAPEECMVWFTYGNVIGSFLFRHDATAVMIYNDDKLAVRDGACASIADLEEMVQHIEKKGAIGGQAVADFLWAYQNLQNKEMLKRIQSGAAEREHPLEYAAPGDLFKPILKRRGNRYTWRKEFWEPVGEDVDIATYVPSW